MFSNSLIIIKISVVQLRTYIEACNIYVNRVLLFAASRAEGIFSLPPLCTDHSENHIASSLMGIVSSFPRGKAART